MNKPLFDLYSKWSIETFGHFPPLAKVNHLLEEVNELKDALENEKPQEEIESEFADCVLLLYDAMRAFGFNYEYIENLVMKKMLINFQRKWGSPDENGVTRHVEEGNPVVTSTVYVYEKGNIRHIFEWDGVIEEGCMNSKQFCHSSWFDYIQRFGQMFYDEHYCRKATSAEVSEYVISKAKAKLPIEE